MTATPGTILPKLIGGAIEAFSGGQYKTQFAFGILSGTVLYLVARMVLRQFGMEEPPVFGLAIVLAGGCLAVARPVLRYERYPEPYRNQIIVAFETARDLGYRGAELADTVIPLVQRIAGERTCCDDPSGAKCHMNDSGMGCRKGGVGS